MNKLAFLCASLPLILGACGSDPDEDPGGFSGSSSGGGANSGGSGGTSSGGTSSGGTNSGGTSSGGTSSGGTSSGGTNSGGTSSGGASSGGTGGGSCNDTGTEPNDTIAQATPVCSPAPCKIGAKDSRGSQTHGPIQGVLKSGDVDLHTYLGDDTLTGSVNPTVETKDSGFQLCMFAKCDKNKTTEMKGCKGDGSKTTGLGGLEGCCASAPAKLELDLNCKGTTSDDAAIYMRADQANACTSYSLTYHY